MEHRHLTAGEWDSLAADPDYVSLLRARRRFVIPCTVAFIALYLALPLGIGLIPGVMNARLPGSLTVAYAYGLLQFVIAWVLLATYMAAAKRFDARAQAIAERFAQKLAS